MGWEGKKKSVGSGGKEKGEDAPSVEAQPATQVW